MIKMVTEFKITVVHFARPNPMQIVHARGFPAGQKTVENQDWATGPPGHRGPWAAGPPRAAGLLLAKPQKPVPNNKTECPIIKKKWCLVTKLSE